MSKAATLQTTTHSNLIVMLQAWARDTRSSTFRWIKEWKAMNWSSPRQEAQKKISLFDGVQATLFHLAILHQRGK